jgi:hypothetical protein
MSATPSVLQTIVGRALIDAEFRKALVGDVRSTLAAEGYKLDETTISAIESATGDPERVRSFSAAFTAEFLARGEYLA